MGDQKEVKFADSISSNIDGAIETLGSATTVGTLARIATVQKITNYDVTKRKPGEQIEWRIILEGRTTLDQRMISDAVEGLMR